MNIPYSRQYSRRLVINLKQFLEHTSNVLLDQEACFVGRIRRRKTGRWMEWIIDEWRAADRIPSGSNLAPMMDWSVLTGNHSGENTARVLIESIQPKRSHFVVAIVLNPRQPDLIDVLVHEHGQIYLPDDVRFIGPGLFRLSGVKTNSQLNPATHAFDLRASRTMGALGPTYKKCGELTIGLVGAGRGAAELAKSLVAKGVRHIINFDADRIGLENLDAMPHVGTRDIGVRKTIALGLSLKRNQPELLFQYVPEMIQSERAKSVFRQTRFDTVFSFIDSDAGRLMTSLLCQESSTLHVDVGTLIRRVLPTAEMERSGDHEQPSRRMFADIRLFDPGSGCIACVPPMNHLDDALYEMALPKGCLHRGQPSNWNDQRAGSLLHLNTLATSVAVEKWLGYLEGHAEHSQWTRIRWPAGTVPSFDDFPVDADPHCRFCGRR